MALSFFKSTVEQPYDLFAHRMNRALETASAGFKTRHGRSLRLGSAVKLPGRPDAADEKANETSFYLGDVIRVPIEVRGGSYEYAIAYLEARSSALETNDGRRMEAIARDAARAAEPYLDRRPEKPGEVALRYP